MNTYEGIFIIKPDFKEEEVKDVCKTITDIVAKNGGNVKKEENWGKKPLAYPVKKFREGFYYKLDFEAPADAVAKLETAYKLNADILRTMITRR
ncbi:MAG: 30S ribosomal protein S6 [Candidatus Omnitrophica bacterium]|nr:30S ribosomal protein S6 [Candidatus Omnitrophota bacterium]MCM8791184.1 30S ribosomal protein S6 [Candidatus Omnitrophota bacterium]